MIETETNLDWKSEQSGTNTQRGLCIFLNPDTVLMNNAVKFMGRDENNPDMGWKGNLYTPERMPCPSFCLRLMIWNERYVS